MKRILILLVLILLVGMAWSEELSKRQLSDKDFPEKDLPKRKIPMKAAALSLLPGCGQIYNESYLKSGIVIGLEAGLVGLAIYHNGKYQDARKKYRISGSPQDYSDYVFYHDQRQSDYFWIGTVVFLSIIDAYEDAHLYDFESKKKKVDLKFKKNALLISYNF